MKYVTDTEAGNNRKQESVLTYSSKFSTQIFPSAVISPADKTLPVFVKFIAMQLLPFVTHGFEQLKRNEFLYEFL